MQRERLILLVRVRISNVKSRHLAGFLFVGFKLIGCRRGRVIENLCPRLFFWWCHGGGGLNN